MHMFACMIFESARLQRAIICLLVHIGKFGICCLVCSDNYWYNYRILYARVANCLEYHCYSGQYVRRLQIVVCKFCFADPV